MDVTDTRSETPKLFAATWIAGLGQDVPKQTLPGI